MPKEKKKKNPVKRTGSLKNSTSAESDAPDKSEPSVPSQPSEISDNGNDNKFLIVGVGASAGGLEALEGFFACMPSDAPMAFVVVQHLDPTHKSIMNELLQKFSAMRIIEISGGLPIEPYCIYLNPPNRNVSVINNRFVLAEPVKTHGPNLPINFFFRALAQDRGNKAIGIVLSGTGTDGTLGLTAIKGAGGMTMVQAEEQAQYSGMPRSAISAGLADFILPVEQMPEELEKYIRHPYIKKSIVKNDSEDQFDASVQKIYILLRSRLGHDFSNYKETTIHRRIERRMAVHRITAIRDYVRFLQETPEEIQKLFKDLLINVTGFFRDAEAFETLKAKGIAPLLENRSYMNPVRIWVPGCATGEEAYSVAMLLAEFEEPMIKNRDIQIFASDLDSQSIDFARNGVYPESIAADISSERLQRFFVKDEQTFRVKKQIRELVVFAEHNLIKDPPFSKLDMVSCRNLMIYLKADLQRKILPLFHYTLNPGGVLFLGTSESIGESSDLFETVDQKAKIFRRREVVADKANEYALMPLFNNNFTMQKIKEAPVSKKIELRNMVERVIIDEYVPPAVMINDRLQVLYAAGNTDKYLMFPSGEPSFDVLAAARTGLKQKLRTAVHEAVRKKRTVRCDGIRIRQDGLLRTVDMLVRPLSEPAFPKNLILIVFFDRTSPDAVKSEKSAAEKEGDPVVERLELELQSTKESLQSTIEELETSNEELKSANEELQSVNEEMQSSNEELKTSKEELQSTNEELATVNAELQHKVNELSRVNNDISNLLASTDIGTIFLDTDLMIKRFTPAMKKIFNLIGTDVDRPISDITSNIRYAALYHDAKEVLDTLVRKEIEVQNSEGRWFAMRISPYRTIDNIIDGVVITFVDITDMKGVIKQTKKK